LQVLFTQNKHNTVTWQFMQFPEKKDEDKQPKSKKTIDSADYSG